MSQQNDHHDRDDDEKAKDGDHDAHQHDLRSTSGTQQQPGQRDTTTAQLNDQDNDNDTDDVPDVIQDGMLKQRHQVIDYLDVSNRLGDLDTEISDRVVHTKSQTYLYRKSGNENEGLMNSDSVTDDKKVKAKSKAIPLTQPLRRRQVASTSNASEMISPRATADVALRDAVGTAQPERDAALVDMVMNVIKQNEADAFKDQNTQTSTAQQQEQEQDQIRAVVDEGRRDIAAFTQTDEDDVYANRDSTLTASNLAPATSDGAPLNSTSASTVLRPASLVRLSQDQRGVKQPDERPGAIRVIQGAGGTYTERPDALLELEAESADAEASQATPVDIESVHSDTIAATLIDMSFDEDGDLNTAAIEEARRIGAERTKRTLLEDAVVADVAQDSKKSRTTTYLIVASICVVIVVGAIIGGVVGSASSGGSASSAAVGAITATPTPAPTTAQPSASSAAPSENPSSARSDLPSPSPSNIFSQSPTMQPTATESSRPTVTDDILIAQKIERVVKNATPNSSFTGPYTLEIGALDWLVAWDEWITLQTEEELIKERYVLVLSSFKMNMGFWFDQYNFLDVTTSVCEWGRLDNPVSQVPVLSCDDMGRVRSISLVANNLSGVIPSELDMLESLRTLDFESNRLGGRIPSRLGELINLEVFRVGSNELNGMIPTEFGNLQVLRELRLSRNARLNGRIPTQMNTIRTLQTLMIEGTGLTNAEAMCEIGIVWDMFQSDCQSSNSTCTCCTHCCLDGRKCAPNIT